MSIDDPIMNPLHRSDTAVTLRDPHIQGVAIALNQTLINTISQRDISVSEENQPARHPAGYSSVLPKVPCAMPEHHINAGQMPHPKIRCG